MLLCVYSVTMKRVKRLKQKVKTGYQRPVSIYAPAGLIFDIATISCGAKVKLNYADDREIKVLLGSGASGVAVTFDTKPASQNECGVMQSGGWVASGVITNIEINATPLHARGVVISERNKK